MENKLETIPVPKGIRYMSDWTDFSLPNYPHIMNKIVTGCGFTEYFLRPNPKYPRVILISPRRILLENKEDQHNNPQGNTQEEIEQLKQILGPIYYARNDLEIDTSVDIDMNSVGKKSINTLNSNENNDQEKVERAKKKVEEYKKNLLNYISECWYDNNRDVRIIVTYDSFRLVREALGNDIYNYQIVVDEFQSLLPDSVFKSDTELSLLHHLRDLRKVCFLSATPMLSKYTQMLSDFKDLPYFELDWEREDPSRVFKPSIDKRQITSITGEAKKEIDRYLEGDFERYSWRDEKGMIQEKYSTELVIYVNSVKNICDIIKKCGLRPDQANILCAKTEDNRKTINKAFKAVDKSIPTRGKSYIGKVPQRGEPHKMFTFCTRTVFLGADFYSTCARSLVLSDANIKCMIIDISTDLLQILGRQRLVKENPWAYSIIFRFKTNFEDISEEVFNKKEEMKKAATYDLINLWSKGTSSEKHRMASNLEYIAKSLKYTNDYVSVNHHMGSDLKPVFNELVMVAERRAFDLQSKDYANRLSVISELDEKCGIGVEKDEIYKFHTFFESLSTGQEKMKALCEFLTFRPDLEEETLINIPLKYKNYYLVLGPRRCYAFNYRMHLLEDEYQKQLQNQGISQVDLLNIIYSSFKEGERYLGSDLKQAVQSIYDSLGLKKTGKASDFEEWFEMKRVNITNSQTKKREPGYSLIKRKL